MPRHSIELGWLNLTPCTKVEWVSTSIPGVKQPILRTAEQRLYAYAEIETDQINEAALRAAAECALVGVAAAGGVSAITANPGGAIAAFKTAFMACFAAKVSDVIVTGVGLHTDTRCIW